MGDVIPFDKVPSGQTAWMSCECTGEPKPFHVIALVQEPIIIAALICPECETTIPVENGIPDASRAVPGGEGHD
jgi:hypothetical protein